MDDIGTFFLKVVIMLMISPLWLPVVKAFWEEANLALADEGGVFGRIPTNAELERMKREEVWRPDPLVHELWGTGAGARRRAATIESREGSSKNSAGPTPRRGAGPGSRRGF